MAASARSTWRRPACTRSAARSGSSASRTGISPAISCCSAAPRTTTATRSRSGWASSSSAAPRSSLINPVRTGYSAIADEWLGITPGTDGLLVLSLVHELLRAGMVDVDYLARYTNAGWLVAQNRGPAGLRPVPARCRGPAAVLGPAAAGAAPGRGWRRQAEPQGRGAHRPRPARPAGVPSSGRALSRSALQPGRGRAADRHSRGHDPADRRRARPCRVPPGDHPRHPLDRRRGATATSA